MKSFVIATLLAGLAAATGTDYFKGDVIINTSDLATDYTYLLWDRETDVVGTEDNYIWKINTQTMFESDTGYRWLRITHYLKANIAHGDVVTFDLAFMTKNDPWTDPKNDMIEDSARCTLLQDSNDDRFWSTTVADYYN